jgi:hypothetical protein
MWHEDCTNNYGLKGADAVHVFAAYTERNEIQ